MAQFQRHFVQELTKPLIVRQCGDLGFSGDNLSDVISVDLYTDGVAYSGGGTCAGACICPDGSTVALTGSVSGKTASVSLTEDCFAIPGQIGIAIRVTSGTTKTTVLKANYNVEQFSTNNPVDPGSRIALDVTTLVNRIDQATADIPASDMASLMAGIAPTFSTSTAYPAGAYVYYNGTLYRFTTAHAAGSWVGTDAASIALAGDVSDLANASDLLFTKEQLISEPERFAGNNITGSTNNNDGSYTIGTTDTRGNITWAAGYPSAGVATPFTLEPGDYYLFGVPNGFTFLSTVWQASSAHNNIIFQNDTNAPKRYHTDTTVEAFVGYRSLNSTYPASFTIYPMLYKLVPTVDDVANDLAVLTAKALQEKNILANNTDLNTVTDSGIYFLDSTRTYSNAPNYVSGATLIVFTVGNVVEQIAYRYGTSARTFTPGIAIRFGTKTSVSAVWHYIGRRTGLRAGFIGDSIIWGRNGSVSDSSDPNFRTSLQIPDTIAQQLGIICDNLGVGSMGWVAQGEGNVRAYDVLSSLTLSDYDALFFCLGVNDGFSPLGTWDSTDETTIMGQFNKCIMYIMNNRPRIRVIVVAPWNGRNIGVFPDYWYGPREHPLGYVSRKILSDTLKRACDYYWIPYIEQYDGPINPYSIQYLIGTDGVHPNNLGYESCGRWLASKIGGVL